MLAHVGDFHLLGDDRGSCFESYYDSSVGNRMSYDPRVCSIQEPTPPLIVRITCHYVWHYLSNRFLYPHIRHREQA